MKTWLKNILYFGVIPSIIAKILFELYLVLGFGRDFFHCSYFVDNDSCSFISWLFNIGDAIVMVPVFIIGIIIGGIYYKRKIQRKNRYLWFWFYSYTR